MFGEGVCVLPIEPGEPCARDGLSPACRSYACLDGTCVGYSILFECAPGGGLSRAADLLQIDRRTLYRKLERWGMTA